MWGRMVWMVLVVAMIGCPSEQEKKDAEQNKRLKTANAALETHRAELQAMFSPVVKAIVADPPPLVANEITNVSAPLIDWAYGGTTIVLTEWLLEGIDKKAEVYSSSRDGADTYGFYGLRDAEAASRVLRWLGGWVKNTRFESIDQVDAVMVGFRKLQYVVVIRVLQYVHPHIESRIASDSEYDITPGRFTAEARVLDMKGASHGGFSFSGTSREDVEGSSVSSLSFQAQHDLAKDGDRAFHATLAKVLPGSRLAFAPPR